MWMWFGMTGENTGAIQENDTVFDKHKHHDMLYE